jgi:anti-sigma factor RsiW
MRCPECQDALRRFLDDEVDQTERREVALHLAECPQCAALVEGDHFWEDAVRRHLDHELPADLRADILGDLAGGTTAPAGWRIAWRIAWWTLLRDLRRPRELVRTAALAVAVLVLVTWVLPRLSGDPVAEPEAFSRPGPVVQMGDPVPWEPETNAPTTRMSLSGRLI